MKTGLFATLTLLSISSSFAAREVIKCESSHGHKVTMDIDYSHQMPSSKSLIPVTGRETATTTSAKVEVTVAEGEYKSPYAGKFEIKEFSAVNSPEEVENFLGTARVQTFQGKSTDKKLDFIINLPYEAMGQSLESFKAELAIQTDKKRDHSAYDLDCSSKIK